MKLRIAALSVLAVAALVGATACSGAGSPAAQQPAAAGPNGPVVREASLTTDAAAPATTAAAAARTITAVGTGTASGTPDTVTVQLGVQTRAKTASAALAQNNTAATNLVSKLKAAGVADKDLQTSGLSVYPTYTDNGSQITGYEVSNMVSATLHDVSKAGNLIDTAEKAAGEAIRVDGISFSFADDSALRAKARADAVKKALAQAKELADAAGVSVGQVLSISESSGGDVPMPMFARPSAGAADAASTPVLPGSADLTVNVQVVVAIG